MWRMWVWVSFGSLARAPNRVEEVRRRDWKFSAVVTFPLSSVFSEFPVSVRDAV